MIMVARPPVSSEVLLFSIVMTGAIFCLQQSGLVSRLVCTGILAGAGSYGNSLSGWLFRSDNSLLPRCRRAYMHCVRDAGALPGLGLTELGWEPCGTIAHMGWVKSKEFKIPTKWVGTELLQKMLLLNLISSAKWAGPPASAPEHKGSVSGHCKGNRRIKRAGWKKRPRLGAWHKENCQLPKCFFTASFPERPEGWALLASEDYIRLWLSWTKLIFCNYRLIQQESRCLRAQCCTCNSLPV